MGGKTIVVLLVGLALASGCVASSGSRHRPCHQLRMDLSISNAEYDWALSSLSNGLSLAEGRKLTKLDEPWVFQVI